MPKGTRNLKNCDFLLLLAEGAIYATLSRETQVVILMKLVYLCRELQGEAIHHANILLSLIETAEEESVKEQVEQTQEGVESADNPEGIYDNLSDEEKEYVRLKSREKGDRRKRVKSIKADSIIDFLKNVRKIHLRKLFAGKCERQINEQIEVMAKLRTKMSNINEKISECSSIIIKSENITN